MHSFNMVSLPHLLAAALLAVAVRGEHTESFNIILVPEQGSNASSSGAAQLRIINSTDQGAGFARYRVMGGALWRRAASLPSQSFPDIKTDLNDAIIAIHIHRNPRPGGPIVLLGMAPHRVLHGSYTEIRLHSLWRQGWPSEHLARRHGADGNQDVYGAC